MMSDEPKPSAKADDWDGEPIILPDIKVEDRPTIVLLANGRSWRRRIGFTAETRRDG